MEDSVKMTEKAWSKMSRSQKERFLTSTGYNKSFAQTKTVTELVQRGGGMVARDLHNTVRLWKKRNPNTDVRW